MSAAKSISNNFTEADHNACPNCKSLQYEIFQLNYDEKVVSRKISTYQNLQRPLSVQQKQQYAKVALPLLEELATRRFRMTEAISVMRTHNKSMPASAVS